MYKSIATLTILLFGNIGCVSMRSEEPQPPPPVNQDTSTEEAFEAGVKFGSVTLEKAKKLIAERREMNWVKQRVLKDLDRAIKDFDDARLINLIHFYQSSTKDSDASVFKKLAASDRKIAQTLAWNLASNFPSQQMKQAADDFMTSKIIAGQESELYLPQMATAAVANGLSSSYTVVRQGLMETGDDAFAKAMITFDPERASYDLVDYLALADAEELRQLSQKSINPYTCLVALKHLYSHEFPISHPEISQIFLYAVSRNRPLADMAQQVIARALPNHRQALALMLSRMPEWMQVAYVEDARRNLTPYSVQLLNELKEMTSHKSVLEEIASIR